MNKEKSAVFLTPKFVMRPGYVSTKYYYDVDFRRGHIAIKEYIPAVVDESGNSVLSLCMKLISPLGHC